MVNDLGTGLLTVISVLASIAALLVLLTAMDPTNVPRENVPHEK